MKSFFTWMIFGVSFVSGLRQVFLLMKKTDGTRLKALSKTYMPKSANQKTYVSHLASKSVDIVVGVGPAGTGKTLFACNYAVERLRSGSIEKIVITRPVVSVEEEIGFLPGNLVSKMDPWTKPVFDILLEFYSQKDIDSMIHGGVIEIAPLAFMRGRTFKHAFVIADEMQNSSPNQMLMLMTRLGEGSKMVITGDLKQSDRSSDNGLRDLLAKLKTRSEGIEGIGYVELDFEDVERSPIVRRVLDLYSGETSSPKKTKSVGETPSPKKTKSVGDKNLWIELDSDASIIPRSLIPKTHINETQEFVKSKWIGW